MDAIGNVPSSWAALGAAITLLLALPAQAIVGGTATSAFQQVGISQRGSNVQIADNWVLTAQHVPTSFSETISNGFGSSTIAARYDFSTAVWPENDLALLRLSTPLLAPQVSLLADVIAPGDGLAIDATLVTARSQAPRGFGFVTVRQAATLIDPDDGGAKPAVTANWLISLGTTVDGPYAQSGDSGGGLFLGHVSDSTSALMGITSARLDYVDAGTTRFGSGFVQLAIYRNWIDSTMQADTSDNQMARWISAVPEPSSALMLLGGLLALGGRRALGQARDGLRRRG